MQSVGPTVQPNRLSTADIGLAQNHYNALKAFQTRFAGLIEDFANVLPTNAEGEPIALIKQPVTSFRDLLGNTQS